MALFADDDTRAFRDAQHAALDRARLLPVELGRAEAARLAAAEAAWLAGRRTRLHPTTFEEGLR